MGEAEASPRQVFDPGGVPVGVDIHSTRGDGEGKDEKARVSLLSIMHDAVPKTKVVKSAMREASISTATQRRYLPKCTLDTGASHGNYIGKAALKGLEFV